MQCTTSTATRQCPTYISDVVQSIKTPSTHARLRSAAETTNYVLPRLRTKSSMSEVSLL